MKLKTGLGDKPLWSQVYDIITERIKSGVYPTGSVLPPEVQLMEEFDVSRITVRQAMDRLIVEELISRRRGKGTIVLDKKDSVSTIFQSSFDNVKEMKRDIKREVLSVKLVKPTPNIRFEFGMLEDQRLIELIRSDKDSSGAVLTVHHSYISPAVGLHPEQDYSGSLYQLLKQKGFPIESVIEEIRASISNKKEKDFFKIKKDTAIIQRVRKGFHERRLIEYSISRYNAEGYTLIINSK